MQNNPSENILFYYHDTPEQVAEHVRLTLAFLGKHKMLPNPVNYTLAYEYLLNRDSRLIEIMDQTLAQGPIANDMAIALYCRFILDNDSRRLEQIRNEIRNIIVETISGVNQASQDTATAAANLNASSNRLLNQEASVQDLRNIVSEVINETQHIALNSNLLKEMLDETRHEIDNLREELDKTRQQATTDPLTGLLNRRGFETALQMACNRASHSLQSLALLIIDIDHFKHINDTYGHLTGDKVLRNVGTILSANIKGKDTVCRFGGEEFAVILPDTTLVNAKQVGDILRLNIERSRLKSVGNDEDIGQVTVSIGVTEYRPSELGDDLIKRADEAMYESKRAGRNRVSIIAPVVHS